MSWTPSPLTPTLIESSVSVTKNIEEYFSRTSSTQWSALGAAHSVCGTFTNADDEGEADSNHFWIVFKTVLAKYSTGQGTIIGSDSQKRAKKLLECYEKPLCALAIRKRLTVLFKQSVKRNHLY